MTTTAGLIASEGLNVGGLYSYNISTQVADLKYLGIVNARAGLQTPGANGYDTISQAASLSASGVKLDLVDEQIDSNGSLDPAAQITVFNSLDASAPGAINAIEGLNEINNQPISYGGYNNTSAANELSAATAYQQAIYSQITSDPTLSGAAVYGFTGYDAYDNATGQQIGGGNQVTAGGEATFQNQHVYPPFNLPPATTQYSSTPYDNPNSQEVSPFLTNGATLGSSIVYTEAGYSSTSPGGSEHLQATDDLDLLLDGAKNGVAKTYLYDLNDGGPPGNGADDGYGLFYAGDDTANPNGAKPVATAIHNLNAVVSAANTGAPIGAVSYNVANEGTAASHLQIDGSSANLIALWNQGTAAASETVSLGSGTQAFNVSVIDPVIGIAPIATYTDVNSVPVSLGTDPLLLKVTAAMNTGTIYVSHFGAYTASDSNAGTIASAPVASFAKAISNALADGDKTLSIDGTFTQPVTLTAAEDGFTLLGQPQGSDNVPFFVDTGAGTLLTLNNTVGVNVTNLAFSIAGTEAIDINGGSGNTVTNTTFLNDHVGVEVENGSNNNVVAQDDFQQGLNGVEIKNQSNGEQLVNDQFNAQTGTTTASGGVYIHGSFNDTISNSDFISEAGAAVSAVDFQSPGVNTATGNITIAHNYLQNTTINTTGTTYDNGSIYLLGRGGQSADPGDTVSDNVINGYGGEGIYLDDNESGTVVQGNEVYGGSSSSDAVEIHGGINDTVDDNIFDLTNPVHTGVYFATPSFPQSEAPFVGDTVSGNVIYNAGSSATGAYAYFGSGTLAAAISGNDYYLAGNPGSYPMEYGSGPGVSDPHAVYANPDIITGYQGNNPYQSYVVSSSSVASSIGFQQPPTGFVGFGLHPGAVT